ncbi:DUF3224 domain-containing protein [Labedaea rhizosphaerae]|uniref:Uncharacterized protein DUF3224 n=1 Tax=Labedaea rhizosphaerae TaxID=598644 RepID=A0A4R6S2Y3_LABRH|nr:DUF3224 domain-containing protein [Labedaea rhizosphaerae]TDP94009.1 uncharacterized protein DUF3224 [Labedaea rhizosphaerae]
MRASCSFTVETTETSDPEWEGGAIQRNRLAKVFTGEVEGTSVVEAIMFGKPDGSTAAYVGIERFAGTVAGAKGSFVLVHRATIVAGEQVAELTILPGTGTDELEGITGTADLLPDHNMTLHYEL